MLVNYGLDPKEIRSEEQVRERIAGEEKLEAYDLDCIAKSLLIIVDELQRKLHVLEAEIDPEGWPKEWDADERAQSEEHWKAVRAREEEIKRLEHPELNE